MACSSQEGIQPMWEDNRNKRGGRWLLSLAKQQRYTELDRLWLETVSGRRGVEVQVWAFRSGTGCIRAGALTVPFSGPAAVPAGGEF